MNVRGLFCGLFVFGVPLSAPGQERKEFQRLPPTELIQRWRTQGSVVRTQIEEALIDKRAEALPELRAALVTGDSDVKRFACTMLAQMRDREAIDDILSLTNDSDEAVRTRAITALRVIGDRTAAPRIRELLQTVKEGPVVKVSLAAIGTLGSPDDTVLIRKFLSHPDKHVQVLAGGALGMLGDNGAEDFLVTATTDSDPLLSKSSIQALGFLNTPGARKHLQEIIDEPGRQWKSYAAIGIAHQDIAGKPATEQIRKLGELVKGKNELVTEWALDRLVSIETPASKQVLEDLIKDGGKIGAKVTRTVKATGKE